MHAPGSCNLFHGPGIYISRNPEGRDMKSLLIVLTLCAVFLVLSDNSPLPANGLSTGNARPQACTAEEKKQKTVQEAVKPRAAKLPRWHRLIPGMFR